MNYYTLFSRHYYRGSIRIMQVQGLLLLASRHNLLFRYTFQMDKHWTMYVGMVRAENSILFICLWMRSAHNGLAQVPDKVSRVGTLIVR